MNIEEMKELRAEVDKHWYGMFIPAFEVEEETHTLFCFNNRTFKYPCLCGDDEQ